MQSTNNKLIQLLSQNTEQHLPGQALAVELGINQDDVLKQIQILRESGYQIEGIRNKGYRMTNDYVNEKTLRTGLKTTSIGQNIIHYETTASTQLIAHQLADEGAVHGTVIVADEQTNGRGRMNRSWHSSIGGLWLSIILRPAILPYKAPQLTLLTATVLANVLQSKVKVTPQIKWPNDLLIRHKKVAGILTEMQTERNQINYIIVGIGININHTQAELPTDIQNKATSIRLETNQQWSRRYLFQAILHQFESVYTTYLLNGFAPIKTSWERYGYKLGEQVLINNFQRIWQATLVGISDDGALLAKNNKNDIEKIHSAEIQWYNETW